MTNYLAVLTTLAALFAGACPAAGPPAAKAARFTQAPGTGSLEFLFMQAGAENQGSFRQFSTELAWDEKDPAAGALTVTVQTASLDTQDKDRNDALAGAELLDTAKYPTAQYVASHFAKRADGQLEAVGRLTLHGVTKELRVPLTIRSTAGGLELAGELTLRRLDFAIGQGEWQSTEWVGNDVKLRYKVPLVRSK
jgi:polyisoprenoid-binding protein YceI